MARHFFDTSALAKHYRAEVGTAHVDALLAEAGSEHLISALSIVEMHSILARLVRMGEISDVDFHHVRGRFLGDLPANPWQVIPLTATNLGAAK